MKLRNVTGWLPTSSRKSAQIGSARLDAAIECSPGAADLFDITLILRVDGASIATPALQEHYRGVSLHPGHPRYAPLVLGGSEIARLADLLAAGEPYAPGAPAEPRRRRRLRWPSVARPRRLAATFALLALLFPGVAFIPVATADDGGGVTAPPVVTAPTTPTRTPPPTDTTPTTAPPPTDTIPTDTTPTDTTPTDTTPTDTAPTDTTPTETTPTGTTTTMPTELPVPSRPEETLPTHPTAPPTIATTTKTVVKKKHVKPAGPKVKPEVKPVNKPAETPVEAPTLTLPSGLDPTPPSLRLKPAFAADLAAVAARANVNWALLLGTIRARGGYGGAPVSEPELEDIATHLAALGASSYPRTAAVGLLGSNALTNRALALSNYYTAVGLPALVHGLKWAKPSIAGKVLSDPRVHIYPGGIGDIKGDRIDVRVLAAIEYLAQTYDEVTVSCLISGHGLYARPGVISAHIFGLAVDIAAVKNIPIAGHQREGGITESAVRSILMLPPEMQPNQVISLFNLGGPSFALANHWDHIHIGYSAAPLVLPNIQHTPSVVPAASGTLLQLWQSAGSTYGVPWQVLAAINKIESNFGQNLGPSSAGAIGWMQFLPSTWAKWGVDANGDGVANPWEPADSIYGAARYLAAAGARKNLPRAIFAYNHAQWYVNEVLQLATLYGAQGAGSLAGIYAPSGLADEDVPTRLNARLQQDAPFSRMARWGMTLEERLQPDLFSRWINVFADLVGSAQRTVPTPVLTWIKRGGSVFQALAAEQEASRQLSITYDPAIRGQLQKELSAQAASASATQALDSPSGSSTGTR